MDIFTFAKCLYLKDVSKRVVSFSAHGTAQVVATEATLATAGSAFLTLQPGHLPSSRFPSS
jgi:hypothetical protein